MHVHSQNPEDNRIQSVIELTGEFEKMFKSLPPTEANGILFMYYVEKESHCGLYIYFCFVRTHLAYRVCVCVCERERERENAWQVKQRQSQSVSL